MVPVLEYFFLIRLLKFPIVFNPMRIVIGINKNIKQKKDRAPYSDGPCFTKIESIRSIIDIKISNNRFPKEIPRRKFTILSICLIQKFKSALEIIKICIKNKSTKMIKGAPAKITDM